MNVLRTAATTVTAALAVAAGLIAGAGTASASASEAVYAGTATITLAAYDYCDFSNGQQRRPAGRQTFTLPVNMTVSEPLDGERSPLHFTLQTDPAGAPGGFLVTTAQSAATTQGSVVLPFWNIEVVDESAGRFAGVLAEDHVEESFAANQFAVVQHLVPCRPELGTIPQIDAMAEGAELAGAIDADAAVVEFRGTTGTQMWDYQVSAELSRQA